MEVLIEQIAIYGSVILLCGLTIFFYMRSLSRKSAIVEKKVAKAKEEGMFEPVSLHPYIDLNTCIGALRVWPIVPRRTSSASWMARPRSSSPAIV